MIELILHRKLWNMSSNTSILIKTMASISTLTITYLELHFYLEHLTPAIAKSWQ